MKKIRPITAVLLLSLLLSLFLFTPALALEDPELTANAVILIERSSGQELYSKNADERVYPASTTKIMTVMLACEAIENGEADGDAPVTATENMLFDLIDDGSSVGLQVGETMSLENLLYCAMLNSGNDACNVIAEYIAGSIPRFISRMNERAGELGCMNTHFANTHGIPNSEHYTTARDLAKIAQAASESDLFMQICSTATRVVPSTNLSDQRDLSNSNALINPKSMYGKDYVYENASGMKTGHTEAAGYCLVSTAADSQLDLLAVVMGSLAYDRGDGTMEVGSFSDTITLLDWGFNNFSYQSVLRETEFVASVPVSMAAGTDSVSLRPQDSLILLLPNDEDLSLYERDIILYPERDDEELGAPVPAGTVLGEISISKNDTVLGRSLLITTIGVELSKTEYLKQQVRRVIQNEKVHKFVRIALIVLAVYFVWVIIYRIVHLVHKGTAARARRARRRARRAAEREAARIEREQRYSDYDDGDDVDFGEDSEPDPEDFLD